MQAVKAGKFEDRYENALVELLNQEAQARAGTNGRETARYRQRRQPDGAGKSLNDVGKAAPRNRPITPEVTASGRDQCGLPRATLTGSIGAATHERRSPPSSNHNQSNHR